MWSSRVPGGMPRTVNVGLWLWVFKLKSLSPMALNLGAHVVWFRRGVAGGNETLRSGNAPDFVVVNTRCHFLVGGWLPAQHYHVRRNFRDGGHTWRVLIRRQAETSTCIERARHAAMQRVAQRAARQD